MTKTIVTIIAAGLLAACAAETSSAPPPPASCDSKTERVGTYLATYTEKSGTCGQLDQKMISLNPGTGGQSLSEGCELRSDVWSEGECKSERVVRCQEQFEDRGGVVNMIVDSTFVTRQMTEDGARIEGTFSLAISGDVEPCSSVYSFVMVRQ